VVDIAIPAEGTYSDIERDWIDNEPPGLFPGDQNGYYGQVRKVFADYLQVLADMLTTWYSNLDPATVNLDDMPEWENELGIPLNAANRSLPQRQAFAMSRLQRGSFTRTRRRLLVEAFITATFGVPISFTAGGVPFDGTGIPFFAEDIGLAGTYNIVENIPAFSYDVRILNTFDIDQAGLQRELERITPAGITFTITPTAAP
jgi:hypothetical protein